MLCVIYSSSPVLSLGRLRSGWGWVEVEVGIAAAGGLVVGVSGRVGSADVAAPPERRASEVPGPSCESVENPGQPGWTVRVWDR